MKVIDKRAKKIMTGMLEMWFVTGTTITQIIKVMELLSMIVFMTNFAF